jgi:hypothetical protein
MTAANSIKLIAYAALAVGFGVMWAIALYRDIPGLFYAMCAEDEDEDEAELP